MYTSYNTLLILYPPPPISLSLSIFLFTHGDQKCFHEAWYCPRTGSLPIRLTVVLTKNCIFSVCGIHNCPGCQ